MDNENSYENNNRYQKCVGRADAGHCGYGMRGGSSQVRWTGRAIPSHRVACARIGRRYGDGKSVDVFPRNVEWRRQSIVLRVQARSGLVDRSSGLIIRANGSSAEDGVRIDRGLL